LVQRGRSGTPAADLAVAEARANSAAVTAVLRALSEATTPLDAARRALDSVRDRFG
jgi:hypothetical protein